jgi:hypothetical protein
MMGAVEASSPGTVRKPQSLSFPGGGVKAFFQFGVAEAIRKTLGDVVHEYEIYGTFVRT